jgi:pSer/pThr/pTyr-binding forkhead associated (FHA) protein
MPAKLILSMDGLVLKEVALNKERISIGRKPDNEIHIDNLAVSGHHAVIVTILNDSFLEDLHSTNGTLVNGRPVDKHFLQNGDVVEVGKYKLKYVSEQPGAQGGPDYEKTMVLRQPVRPQAPAEAAETPAAIPKPAPAAPPPAAAEAAGPRAAIQILSGPAAGRELELTKNLTTLGRPGVQVAVITRRSQGFFITHVEGSNYPIVNGKILDAQPHTLQDHDVVELAGVKMEFFLKS